MSKAKQSVNVETKNYKNSEGQEVSELVIGKDTIGTIVELEAGKFQVTNTDNDVFHTKSFDEGAQMLIKHFHLHH
ncbi:DUF2969 domain-containing protein [Lentilactobacillus sp. Marseille-Q4993]|uniref:DUF2969 domain-containing protein n=1 Tax=Lentilactobacillus sp. Marseille-Q4993 TaxID=3039492 RepID=UPI0024BC0AE9|nr:DUF2969 domain-containing protein [Lentilactobacillus sp. Marseille-Q4993]